MNWYDACDNPKVIAGYYSSPPALDRLEVRSIVLDGDAPVLRLSALLPVFPDRPSKRWHPDTNTAEIGIDLWCPAEVRIEGWSKPVGGTFSLQQAAPQRLTFIFRSDTAFISGICVAARISGVTGYVRRNA
jgi:hypothetical protein